MPIAKFSAPSDAKDDFHGVFPGRKSRAIIARQMRAVVEAVVEAVKGAGRRRAAADRPMARRTRSAAHRPFCPMKRLISGLALLAASLVAEAGGLDQLNGFLEANRSARGVFTQTVIAKSGRKPQQSSGIFALQRPGKFRWSYESPYKQLLVSDGNKLWSYDPELNQVAVRKLGAAFGASPAALLAGQDLDKHFELRNGGAADGIEFVDARPKGSDTSFESVRIGFAAKLPVSMEIRDSFGQVTVLRFTQFEANPKLPAGLFQFVAPAGADVVGD